MKRIVLLGMPNTGKSTYFNRLTGASARVGNWPGVTVDLLSAKILVGGAMAEVVDLPGIYDLHGFSDDEKVVRHFLEDNPVDLAVLLVNAVQVERQLSLVLQLQALGLPAILLLNMADEARQFGIHINTAAMAQALGMPVVLFSAKYGDAQKDVLATMAKALGAERPAVPPEKVRQALHTDHAIEADMARIVADTVQVPARLSDNLTDKLDRVVLHPWLGLPLFFLAMFLLFQAVFFLGQPLQDGMAWLFDQVQHLALEPLLAPLPELARGFLLDGVYSGLSTVAAFVPIIVLFFLFMAVVEDTGYLSRAAYLTDALMAKLGLDGRSFVMLLMGFGCNVPAAMGTRVMRSRPLRLLSMLIIPLSLCSARLQVFLFIIAALFSPSHAGGVLFSLYLFSFATAIITALLFKRRFPSTEPFVLELPPYRLPTLRQVLVRGWLEVQHFLKRASKIIIAGVVLVWALTHFPVGVVPASDASYAGMIGHAMEPILSPIGISAQLAVALIFGFVAKEVVIGSLAVIFGAEGSGLAHQLAGHMDWVQAYSFMLFTLIYTPCLSTIATLKAESRSLGFATLAVVWPLALAWGVSFLFYQGARALGF
ncbi:ferrous iron transport protein B [Azospira inquinata]|uniref:Ferrous iron transport protein B n=1 Tax=Azospira inquinata TaxID=2785627 RepID=A0A975SL61_9RHOO|nr:ferrous iron transport protein B [Azospira inquinata]QWT46347.1 ferrous iron transport protein B [Azospira inquinata]QWT48327.1 ferrous iron transport protein B [Azospira inquinata]